MSGPEAIVQLFNNLPQLLENKTVMEDSGDCSRRAASLLTKSNERRTKALSRSLVPRIILTLTIGFLEAVSQPMLILSHDREPLADGSSTRAGAGPKSIARKWRRKPLKSRKTRPEMAPSRDPFAGRLRTESESAMAEKSPIETGSRLSTPVPDGSPGNGAASL